MRRDWLLHGLFAATLLCMAAMVGWWTFFMSDAVEIEQRVALAELQLSVHEHALELGNRSVQPQLVNEGHSFELLACDQAPDNAVTLAPQHPDICLSVSGEAIQRIATRLKSRRNMVNGEGSFLVGLLAICTFMLYYLMNQKARHAQRMESFFHAATHEMKTPLTGIKTLLETLLAGRIPDDEHDRLLRLGLDGCHLLEHRIENVLIAGGLSAGQQHARVSEMALAPLLCAFIEHRRHALAGRSDDVRLTAAVSRHTRVFVDPDFLRIALENLVDNGLKYGGDTPLVEITVTDDDQAVFITVADNGIGFDSTVHEGLFTPYQRALSTGHKIQHGTGLGLSIARDLCRRMDGDLVAFSAGPNKGATFTISLKSAPQEII